MDIGIFNTFGSKLWSAKYRFKEKRKVSEPNFTNFREKMVLTSKMKKETIKFKANITSRKAKDKANDIVAKKKVELGVCASIDSPTESQIHNVVWKEFMEDETHRGQLVWFWDHIIKVTKLSDDLRKMRKGSSSSDEVHASESTINIIKGMENTIKDLQS
ncbi:hypothetical protein Cgig2_030960 [Carnegiea gigantea]|uniref:Uncharacterized protein n=1 Tax=Carnegiea gigantea TaxID=171969 RepID=A0A9Q1K458_9CARY|nr:hypothetical protein Cgig2_017398 [Carnegiea gigantea]KAJ8436448.1 hypothetical protein Cgig2_030960 [Carnegiea gigantea]